MEDPVRHAVGIMWARYFEPITLEDLASEVYISPFHFLRVFSRATGTTPGRYLSALRMFQAKRMLLTTNLTVSAIVCSVGYSSVGTFTTRFTRSVGMTPNRYRDPEIGALLVAAGRGFSVLPGPRAMAAVPVPLPGVGPRGRANVVIRLPQSLGRANVFVGLFAAAIPQASPVTFSYLRHTGSTTISMMDVPVGKWTAFAVAEPVECGQPAILVGTTRNPVSVSPGQHTPIRLDLHPLRATDAPVAVSLAVPARPALAVSPSCPAAGRYAEPGLVRRAA